MQIAPPAPNETQRVAVLQSYDVLDTAAEKAFDELADLAAHICETPIALISLVDHDRQWFKAAHGLTDTQTSRNISFCAHAILQSEIFVVPDTTLDERFADNPLVTGAQGVRFYAGVPLTAPEGEKMGTLCVWDRRPRALTREQTHALSLLSRHVMRQLELRRQKKELTRVNNALIGILEDERLAEKAARESKELNRNVLDSILAQIAVLDREGKIIAVNEAWRKFGEENFNGNPTLWTRIGVGANYLDSCRSTSGESTDESRLALAGLESVLNGRQKKFTLEYPCHSPTQKRWFILSVTPLKTSAGGAAVSHLDITERKLAEQRIAEQAEFLDKARDAILVRDLAGNILFWNQGAERVYGWTSQEAYGRPSTDLFYVEREKFESANRATIEQGEWTGELQHRTKSRGIITVEARWTLIRDDEGKPKSILAINTDITEKKKIEAQFLRAQRMESIGTLASGVAHDLNNILAPIMMSIEVLKEMSPQPQIRDILETIDLSAKRGADIVRQVLSFARGLDGERLEIQPKHLVRDIEKILRDTFPKAIRQRFRVSSDISTVRGDPTQLQQILLNLCVNARDAMPHGGTLTVEVENCHLDEHYAAMNPQSKPGRYVKIRVTDTGTGIPRELLDKIFEPFFTTKEINKGTGLGLSTVMAIVKSHQGTVNVYSELGKGTSFNIYLPAMETEAGQGQVQAAEGELPRGNGELILLADDEASILTITSQTLEAFGYRVLKATDGAAAVGIYAQHQSEVAVVLTDMMMPVMDGASAIHALLRINPAVKVIAASGLSAKETVARLSDDGVRHFLTKPYTAGALLRTLQLILTED